MPVNNYSKVRFTSNLISHNSPIEKEQVGKEKIGASSIVLLTANHLPTEFQNKQKERLVKDIFTATDHATCESALAEIKELVNNLCQTKKELYEEVQGTNNSSWLNLKPEYNSVHVDNYVRDLRHVYNIARELGIKEISCEKNDSTVEPLYGGAFEVNQDEKLVDGINRDIAELNFRLNKKYFELPNVNDQRIREYRHVLSNIKVKQESESYGSFITQLDSRHQPTEAQKEQRAALVESLRVSRGKEARKPTTEAIKSMRDQLYLLREDTFEIVNEDTKHVYGKLKPNRTEKDRDNYIRDLVNYCSLKKDIEQMQDENELRANEVNGLFAEHHSTPLNGDIRQLRLAEQGKAFKIPDLTYNKGRIQFG